MFKWLRNRIKDLRNDKIRGLIMILYNYHPNIFISKTYINRKLSVSNLQIRKPEIKTNNET